MPQKNHVWIHKEPLSQRFFKEPSRPYLFYNLKNLLSPQITFSETESDIRCSLWSHLDKKFILWHREAPLFLRVHRLKHYQFAVRDLKLFMD